MKYTMAENKNKYKVYYGRKYLCTSASIMKVDATGLQECLIMSIRSGNLEVDSFPFLEKTRIEPSTNLWI